jgi:uncharacterized membrane protein YfcA
MHARRPARAALGARIPPAALAPPAPAAGAAAAGETAIPRQQARAPALHYWSAPFVAVLLIWIASFLLLSAEPASQLRAHGPLFFMGLAGAVIGNATAVGGGLIFVPATMFFYDMDPLLSLRLAITCQAFGMTSGAVAWWLRGAVPVRAVGYGLPALLLGCALGGLVFRPEAALVKGLFGPISIAIGLCTLLFARRPAQGLHVPPLALLGVMACALAGAVITAWVAIGVGEVVAAYLMMRWGVRAETSIALGVVYLSICSIVLALFYQWAGLVPWQQVAFMGLGCIMGARLGPWLTQRVPERWVKVAFATIAIGDGALFTLQYNLG